MAEINGVNAFACKFNVVGFFEESLNGATPNAKMRYIRSNAGEAFDRGKVARNVRGAVEGRNKCLEGVGPEIKWCSGIIMHSSDGCFHGAEPSFDAPILLVGIRAGKTLNNAELLGGECEISVGK